MAHQNALGHSKGTQAMRHEYRIVGSGKSNFPRPENWQDFEHLCQDLWAHLLKDPNTQRHGRQGQRQLGVDVYGYRSPGHLVGIQCKGRNSDYGPNNIISASELQVEVEKAKGFANLKEFIVATTAPSDVHMDKIAREISEYTTINYGFTVNVFGWGWINGHLQQNIDIALKHNLAVLVEECPEYPTPLEGVAAGTTPEPSQIDAEIGNRFRAYVESIKSATGRDLADISKSIGEPDWRRLSSIYDGKFAGSRDELEKICAVLFINSEWLISGRSSVYYYDSIGYNSSPLGYFDHIKAVRPRRVYFVRNSESPWDATVVVEIDDVRAVCLPQAYHISSIIGATGASQLFDFLCLIRRLDSVHGISLGGRHVSREDMGLLRRGEVHPRAIIRSGLGSEDPWWDDFADRASSRIGSHDKKSEELQRAIASAVSTLDYYKSRSAEVPWMAQQLNDSRL